MEDFKREEKSPLLLYLVEEDTNVSKNNKRVNFDKGRLYGISSGATAVFTEFPNYVSPCSITALLSSLIFFMMVLLMVSSIGSSRDLRIPRCTNSHPKLLSNKTIYLIHDSSNWSKEQIEFLEKIKCEYQGYDVHLVLVQQTDRKRNDFKEVLDHSPIVPKTTIDSSLEAMTGINAAILEIKRANRTKRNTILLRRNKRDHLDALEAVGLGFRMKHLLDILLRSKAESTNVMLNRHANKSKALPEMFNLTDLFSTTTQTPRPKTLDDIIDDFPALTVKNATAEEIFSNSPLHRYWAKFNPDLLLFAVRAMYLWQYGGLSFKLDVNKGNNVEWENVEKFSVTPKVTPLQTLDHNPLQIMPHELSSRNDILHNFILSGRKTFENMPKEVVTADEEGLHIFTKSPCHAFFGEVLANLRRASGDETPKMIIKKSLKVFCKYSAVGSNYCRNLVRGTS